MPDEPTRNTDISPIGTVAGSPETVRDEVELASRDSFPASDAPAWINRQPTNRRLRVRSKRGSKLR